MNTTCLYHHQNYVLDASSAINLYATGYLPDILRFTPVSFAVSMFVKEREALHVLGAPDSNGQQECIPIDLDSLVSSGLLEAIRNDSHTIASHAIMFSKCGLRGMGEIISAAIAKEHGYGIVLDDKRATVKLEPLLPNVQILTTFDVVRLWAQGNCVSDTILREVLCNIRISGKYHIAKDHPLFNWVTSHGG